MTRPRLRTCAKWAFTLAAVLSAIVAAISLFYVVSFSSYNSWTREYRHFALGGGSLWVFMADYRTAGRTFGGEGWTIQSRGQCTWDFCLVKPTALVPGRRRWAWGGVDFVPFNPGFEAGISVLYPVLVTAAPAAVLWWIGPRRRIGPHQCARCGYDRGGLAADAACPECGAR